MKIVRLINNNILCSLDENGNEIIVTGCGIGFKRKAGEELDPSKVEKIYHMKDKKSQNKLQELVEEIPLERMVVCSDLIEYFKTKLTSKLNENILITLTDHISFAIERKENDLLYSNPLLLEIREFYPAEYELGKYSVDYIFQKLGIMLSEDEAGFIALHIVNAELDTKMSDMFKITELINAVVKDVEDFYGKDFNKNSVYFDRFVVHLRFFAQRLFNNKVTNMSKGSEDFRLMIRKTCPQAAECADGIAKMVKDKYGYTLDEEEIMYLTIHLKRINMVDN